MDRLINKRNINKFYSTLFCSFKVLSINNTTRSRSSSSSSIIHQDDISFSSNNNNNNNNNSNKMAAFTFPVASPNPIPKSDGRVKRPREFTCFSYDRNRELRLDDSGLKWYYPPSQGELDDGRGGMDLSRGFERFDKHDEEAAGDEHLVGLLRALMDWEERNGKSVDAKVVTWRGMMTKIMAVGGGNGDDDG